MPLISAFQERESETAGANLTKPGEEGGVLGVCAGIAWGKGMH